MISGFSVLPEDDSVLRCSQDGQVLATKLIRVEIELIIGVWVGVEQGGGPNPSLVPLVEKC